MHPSEIQSCRIYTECTNDRKTQCRLICFIIIIQITIAVIFFLLLKALGPT